ncbi:hypothetical protein AGOR_G00052000 [Albula goreensis]|uniref:CUB domain-containing protein n=1 Tax=Albula goreensis TaxID=1534307 RepID=A0A8T3DW94_9TELE|nr:hypothetical protein AGOR_G00052000 [Albula goreensis]
MHMPKPITIQGCLMGDCGGHAHSTIQPHPQLPTWAPGRHQLLETTSRPASAPGKSKIFQHRFLSSPLGPLKLPTQSTVTIQAPPAETSMCGQLLLQDSGTVDLRNASSRFCTLSIGRPLDEVIVLRVEFSSLNCKNRDYLQLSNRRMMMRKCHSLSNYTLTTRTNFLIVRQGRVSHGNGIRFSYHSQKNTKMSHHGAESCDMQLFGPSGQIKNPTRWPGSGNQTCRTFINVPPGSKIQIQAVSARPVSDDDDADVSTFILIRDVDIMQTTWFQGGSLFQWRSFGSSVEMEFHGDYLNHEGSFQAEYSVI